MLSAGWNSWWETLRRRRAKAPRAGGRRRERYVALASEPLESRLALALFTWNTDASGNWEVAGNWLNNDTFLPGVPGSSDTVVIDRAGANPVVSVTTPGQSALSLRVADSLRLTGGSLQVGLNTQIDATGTLDFAGDFTITGGGSIINNGTVRKSAGVGESLISKNFDNNGAAIDVQSGKLTLGGGGVRDGGSISAAAGATLDLTGGSNSAVYKGTFTGGGAGHVELASGTLFPDNGGVTLDFDDHFFQWTGGAINAHGSRPLINNGQITLAGSNAKSLFGPIFINSGASVIHDGTGSLELVGSPASIEIEAGGVYDLISDADMNFGDVRVKTGGTLRKSAGTGDSRLAAKVSVQGGTVDVQTGTLTFAGANAESTGGTLDVQPGATLDLTGNVSTVTYGGIYTGQGGGQVVIAGGTFATPSGGATFQLAEDMFRWTGGTIFAPTNGLTITSFLTLAGAFDKVLAGALTNNGTITHEDGGNLLLNGSTIFTNAAGGIYNFKGTGGIGHSNQGAGFSEYVQNDGTIFKTVDTGTVSISMPLRTSSTSVFDVLAGRLILAEGGLWQGATMYADTGAVLEISNGAAMTGLFTGLGDGRVEFTGGTLGSYDFGVSGQHATLNFPEGLAYWTGGAISSGGSGSSVGSGTTLVNAGFLTLEGADAKGIGGTGLINTGTIVNSGPGDFALNGAVFDNRFGGVYEQRGDSIFTGTDQFNNAGRFLNAGTFLKSSGSGTVTLNARLENAESGVIEVQAGRLQFSRGGNSTGGTFQVDSAAVLEFTGNDTFNWTGTYTGSGPGRVEVTSLLNGSDGNNPARLDFPAGLFHMLSGQLLGSIVNVGVFDFAPATGLFTRAGITNLGTWIHSGAGDWVLNANSRITNVGLFDLQTDADFVSPNDGSGGTAYFINSGTFRKSNGLGVSSFRHDGDFRAFQIDNTGTVDVQSGTLSFDDGGVQFSGSTLAAGEWIVRAFATLTIPSGSNFTTNFGNVTLDGPNSSFARIDSLATNRGSFILQGGRDFTTAGNLTNSGQLTAGPGSTLTVNGTLTESAVNNLVGWWRGEGDALDASTAGNNGSLAGDTTFAAGQFGSAFSFDGNGDYVNLGNPASLRVQDFTISAWIKREDSPADGGLIFGYGLNGYSLGLFADGRLLLTNVGFSEVHASSLAVTDGNFHHVAVTKSGNTVTFYVDGAAEMVGGYSTFFGFGTNAAIGSRADSPGVSDSFQGRIDEVAVFNRPLTGAEIDALRFFNNPPAVGNLPPTLNIQVADRPGTGQFGQINATGAATLTGRLNIDTAQGFAPPQGDVYPVMSFPSRSGNFTSITGVAGLYDVDVQNTAVVLNSIAAPPIDLAVESIGFTPASAQPGQSVTVNYVGRNLADAPATGSWTDSIYVSRDITYSPDDVLFARVTHTGGVGNLTTYNGSATAPLPGLIDGEYHVIVITNSRGEAAESNRNNNTAASTNRIAVTIPELAFGSTTSGTLASGQDLYFRVNVPAGGDVVLSSLFATLNQGEFLVRLGALPTRSQFDFAANDPRELARAISLASPQAGSYYILLHGREGAGAGQPFSLSAERIALGISSLSPARGANVGTVTSTILGAGFTPGTVVELVNGVGAVVSTATVRLADSNRLFATFNLVGLAPGAYDVRATSGPLTATLDDGFEVIAGVAGHVELGLSAPRYIRAGTQSTLTVEYWNAGDTDVAAPSIIISSDNARFRLPDQPTFTDSRIELLGINTHGPAGILPPGARGLITLVFDPKVVGGHVFSNFEAYLNHEEHPIDWNAVKELYRPLLTPDDVWDATFENLMAALGGTADKYYQVLRENATYLSQFGIYSYDPVRYLDYEIQQAGLFGDIQQRFRLGAFGRGQPDPLDLRASIDAQGNVFIIENGRIRVFVKQANGSFTSGLPDDRAVLTRDGAGVLRLTESNGTLTQFFADGRLDFVESTNGLRRTAHYTSGRITSMVDSTGDTVSYAYNAQGRVSQATDAVGRVTTFTYDASGEHLTSVTNALGTISYAYLTGVGGPREHALASMTLADGSHIFYEYDASGRLVRQYRDGGAEQMLYSYDSLGNYTLTDASGSTASFARDDRGNLRTIVGPTGGAITGGYDSKGRLTGLVQDGTRQTLGRDAQGNNASVVDAAGQSLLVENNDTSNFAEVVFDARGNRIVFAYDADGNVLSEADQAGATRTFTFDANGNLASSSLPSGRGGVFTYNAAGLITHETYADGTEVSYTYDAHRNVETMTDEAGTTTFTYNAADLVTRVDYPNGRWVEYSYNAIGLRTRLETQDGFVLNYFYDLFSRLSRVSDAANATLATYAYDTLGRLSQEVHGNGTSVSYTYEVHGNVASITHRAPDNSVLEQFVYAYDAQNRRTSVTTLAGVTQYEYDLLGQLTRVEMPGGRVLTYEYDAEGNRLRATDNGVATDYATNNLNQYTAAGATSFTHDVDGNLIGQNASSGVTQYVYDGRGRLTGVTTNTDTWAYEYDVLGNRTASVHNGVRTEYLVDPQSFGTTFLAEYDANGDVIAHYAQGLGLIGRIDDTGATGYYHFDVVGNTAAITGASGTVLNQYTYLPFGEKATASETIANPFTFDGKEGVLDRGDGLYAMARRVYDPVTGRFTQRDPAGYFAGDANLYRYAENQPTVFTDPSGLIQGIDPVEAELSESTLEAIFQKTIGEGSKQALEAAISVADSASALVDEAATSVGRLANSGSYFTEAGDLFVDTVKVGAGIGSSNPTIRNVVLKQIGDDAFALGLRKFLANGFVRVAGRVAGPVGVVLAMKDAFDFGRTVPGVLHGDEIPTEVEDVLTDRNKDIRENDCFRRLGITLTGNESQEQLTFYLKLCADLERIAPTEQLASNDPNSIVGPAGWGALGFLRPEDTFPYTVFFENLATASAPAQVVTITHQLDSDFDWSTFELGDFGFGSVVVDVPDGVNYYHTQLPLPASAAIGGAELLVDFTAGLDLNTGLVTWTFTSLDPTTGDAPANVLAGFLPPNDGTHRGEGFVNFRVRPLAALPTGTQITAQATIVFDNNDPINTQNFLNTIDNGDPVSRVNGLPATVGATFVVSWSTDDDAAGPAGAGAAFYDVFVSDNGGPFELWQAATSAASAEYTGEVGHTYRFYSVVTDGVGHGEEAEGEAQATTTVTVEEGGSIAGYVYVDVNNNGVKDPAELGLPNVPVTITGPVTRTTLTAANGAYRFDDLPAGTYTITETQPSAFNSSQASGGGAAYAEEDPNVIDHVGLTAGGELAGYNFGERGLKAGLITKRLFLASTPPSGQLLLELLAAGGNEAFAFTASNRATLTVDGEGEGTKFELYTSSWLPVALGNQPGQLTAELAEGEGYILLVHGASAADLSVQMFVTALLEGKYSFFTNHANRHDVDHNGAITNLDAFRLISELRQYGAFPLQTPDDTTATLPLYLDVNGDGQFTNLDVFTLITHLRSFGPSGGAGEGESLGVNAALLPATNTNIALTIAPFSAASLDNRESAETEFQSAPALALPQLNDLALSAVIAEPVAQSAALPDDFMGNESIWNSASASTELDELLDDLAPALTRR